MEPQEIFDRVATHLFTQGHRATMFDDSICAYRASNGDKCAIGVLIPDDVYEPAMEFRRVTTLINLGFPLPVFMARNVPLLTALQEVHDDVRSWRSTGAMKMNLEIVARRYDLDAGILTYLKFAWEGQPCKSEEVEWESTNTVSAAKPLSRHLCDIS
jgi:hypothetical protein